MTTQPPPATRTAAPAAQELRINLPKEFGGDRNDTGRFLLDIDIYVDLNGKIYDSDAKKIAFALSFMTIRAAQQWKEAFLTAKTTAAGTPNLGTYANFRVELLKAFSASDVPGNARAELRNIKQGGSADEYVSQFRILAGRSKITDDTALIEYFMEGLKPKLLEKIYALPTIPTTIDDWYTYASRFDNQWTRVKEIIARNKGTTYTQKKPTYAARYTGTHDPNVMDVDRLTIDERTDHMKKGLCFICHEPGHTAKDCPRKKPRFPTNKFQNLKKTGTNTYAMIRSLYNELNDEDKKICMDKMEEEGF